MLLLKLTALLSIYFLTIPFAVQSPNDELIAKTRRDLYNLNRQGFHGFKASVEPNWEVILGPTAAPESLRIFRAVRFDLTVDANGAITLTHNVADAEKNRVQPYLQQIDDDVRRLLATFFNIWSIFAVRSPFPETQTQINIEQRGTHYFVSYSAPPSDVYITLGSDLVVAEWKLSGPKAKQTIKPRFANSDAGLVLTGYQSLFEPAGDGIKTSMEVNIEYQDVGSLKLPHKVRFRGVHGKEPVEAELRFEQCTLISPGW